MNQQEHQQWLPAWQEAVRVEVRTRPWFAALLLQKGSQLFDRFVYFYTRLTAVGQHTRHRIAVGIGTAALALALSNAPTPAHAATITVGSGCNLVQAIQSANTDTSVGSCTAGSGADTIVLAGGTYSYSTPNGTGSALPNINSNITIEANGATIARDATAGDMRIILVNSGGNLTLNNATITGGFGSINGGGIFNIGTLTLNHSTVSGNTITGDGGGIFNNGGTVTLNHSTITGNTGGGNGGGIFNNGTLTLNHSTVSNNTASTTGGIDNYGSDSTLTLNNSTISGNTATWNAGGISNLGYGTVVLNNSTVSQNMANMGGGIFNGSNSATTLVRSIVSGNTASSADEIYNQTSSYYYNYNYYSYTGTVNANAHNVLGHSGLDNEEAFEAFAPDSADVNATSDGANIPLTSILNPTLANNGGPTLTHALVTGSPAIDIAPAAACSGAPINGIDQRGVSRSQDGNGDGTAGCDAGAVELGELQCGIQSATLPFSLTFAQANNVSVNVTDAGTDLDCVRVTEIGQNHPHATSSMSNMALQTGKYWQIAGYQNSTSATPATQDFTVDLTLSFAGADVHSRACKWLDGVGPGFGWDCGVEANHGFAAGISVTRNGYTGGFSDWAVGDEVGPTAVVNLSSQTNIPKPTPHIPLLATLLTLLSGAWLWLRRRSS